MKERFIQSITEFFDEPEVQERPKIKHLGVKTAAFLLTMSLTAVFLSLKCYNCGIGQELGGIATMLLSVLSAFVIPCLGIKTYFIIHKRVK